MQRRGDRSRSQRHPWQTSSTAQRKAGSDLLKHLMKLYASCRITAQQFAVACHFASEAGVPGGDFK
eukprot:1031342-Pyramimonas_sp.AAC.1